jgi:hypothetical protein
MDASWLAAYPLSSQYPATIHVRISVPANRTLELWSQTTMKLTKCDEVGCTTDTKKVRHHDQCRL